MQVAPPFALNLQIWPSDGATCIRKFDHKMASVALVAYLATKLHWLKIWLSGGALDCPIGIISEHRVGIFISQCHIS